MTPSSLSNLLSGRAEAVCRHLLPTGRRKTTEWVVGDLRGGRGDSLKIRIGGEDVTRIGVWSDFGTGQTGGDLLDLWCAVRGLSLPRAMEEAAIFMGVRVDGEASRPRREWRLPEKPRCERVKPGSVQMDWLLSRGFTPETVESFRLAVSEQGEIVFPYLKPDGRFVNAKYRRLPKSFRQEVGAEPSLFGWQVVSHAYPLARSVTITEGECFTGETQVLTPWGWVRLDQYQGGPVAQWLDHRVSFVEPLAIIEKPYQGNLIQYQVSNKLSSLTTPQHKMVSIDRHGLFYKHTAEDGPKSKADKIPCCGVADGVGIPLTDDQIMFCLAVSSGAWIGELRNHPGSRYVQFHLKQLNRVKRLEDIVSYIGVSVSSNDVSYGCRSISCLLPDWVPGRILPWEWVGLATAAQRELILRGLIYWSGYFASNRSSTEYSSKLLDNAIWVQTMAHLSGRCSSITSQENRFGSWFNVSIVDNPGCSWRSVNSSLVDYSGQVYCVQVPSGAIMIRHNGVISVSGNCDAMALHQLGFPALSVPMGGGDGHKQDWIESDYDDLQRFDTIYLCLDNDEPGRLATAAIIRRLGADRCRVLELPAPFKDANEALLGGITTEKVRSLLAAARGLDPEELKSALVFLDEVIEVFDGDDPKRPPVGVRSPWSTLGRHLMFRPGEVTLWGGFSGSGKSAITNHIAAHALANDTRWCIASMEMPPARTLHRLILQLLGRKPSIAEVREVMGWLGDKLWMFNVLGTSKTDRMMAVFEYAASRYDIRHYVVDSLAKCGIDEDDFNSQKRFVERLTDFARQYNSHLHLVAHARKGSDGEHDHRPGKHDIRGATAITDMVHNVITIWRDRDAEQQVQRSRVVAEVCKQRNHTWEQVFDLEFQPDCFRYLDDPYNPMPSYYQHSA